jgi:ABC-type multidrug transport system fused ATPase/permease subunit
MSAHDETRAQAPGPLWCIAVPEQGAAPNMLAYNYPLLSIFWTMLEFFLFFLWIWLLIVIFADIFRSHDMGGLAKALWVIFVIILPFLGVLIYLIARGGSMQERAAAQAQRQQQAFDSYVKETAGSSSSADELAKLADLKAKGVLTDAEFEAQKAKLLS